MARHLLEALWAGDDGRAKELIHDGAYGCIDSQTAHRDGTALFLCCSHGSLELASLLVEKGACIEARTKWSATPLHAAVDNNHLDVVRHLINLDADLNAQTHRGDTPLHLAAFRGHSAIAQMLVRFGADVTLVNASNLTPLNEAVRQGHPDIENLLRAAQEYRHPSHQYSHAPSGHMVVLSPPTFPSPLVSVPSPFVCPQTGLVHRVAAGAGPRLSQRHGHRLDANRDDTNDVCCPTASKGATVQPQPTGPPDHFGQDDDLFAPLTSRVPEESIDPSVVPDVSTLCAPSSLGIRKPCRRNSSASSVSMTSLGSDCSASGPRSEESSTMSSISDVSSCGGDVRREDFEGHEMGIGGCSVVEEGGKSQPLSDSSFLTNSLLHRTYSNPSQNSETEFSDKFNSSLFNMESLDFAGPSSSSARDQRRTCSVSYGYHPSGLKVKDSFTSSRGLGVSPNKYFQDRNLLVRAGSCWEPRNLSSEETHSPSSSSSRRFAKRQISMPILEHFSASNKKDNTNLTVANHLCNDLSSMNSLSSSSSSSSSLSHSSSPVSSMTFINIPIHE